LDFGLWTLDDLPQKAFQNPPPPGKPPMLTLYAVHNRVGVLLHRLG
jgi:hypothetical protein